MDVCVCVFVYTLNACIFKNSEGHTNVHTTKHITVLFLLLPTSLSLEALDPLVYSLKLSHSAHLSVFLSLLHSFLCRLTHIQSKILPAPS